VSADVAGQARARRALEARAQAIEACLTAPATTDSGLRLVVALLSSVTNTASPSAESAVALPPEAADEIFAASPASPLLRARLAASYSGSASGAHHWIRVNRGPEPWTPPDERLFGVPDASGSLPPTVKPFDSGLYTSTPLTAGYSMWRLYLDQYDGSALFPLPWYTWHLTSLPAARVLTVDDARGWTRLVTSFPQVHDGCVYPNWVDLASRYDGVRVTFPAVIATQGIRFLTPHGPTAPGFWDVESTYWLRWRFTNATLVTIFLNHAARCLYNGGTLRWALFSQVLLPGARVAAAEQHRKPTEGGRMPDISPATRDLARRLLLHEAGGHPEPDALAEAAGRAGARLRGRLIDVVGSTAYTTLLARAVRRAQGEVRTLERGTVAGHGGAEGDLHGVRECALASDDDPAVGEASLTAILVHVIGLLVTFIGEVLTLRLVREAWPELADDQDTAEGRA